MTDSKTQPATSQATSEVFDTSVQTAFIKQFGARLVLGLRSNSDGATSEQIDPLAMVDAMADALCQACVDDEYIRAVEALKGDPELSA